MWSISVFCFFSSVVKCLHSYLVGGTIQIYLDGLIDRFAEKLVIFNDFVIGAVNIVLTYLNFVACFSSAFLIMYYDYAYVSN